MAAGMVVANDVDEKRCFTLSHQLKRLQSPCPIVTKGPAQHFPFLWFAPPGSPGTHNKLFQFDRILCDVPCSGLSLSLSNILKIQLFSPSLPPLSPPSLPSLSPLQQATEQCARTQTCGLNGVHPRPRPFTKCSSPSLRGACVCLSLEAEWFTRHAR